MNCRLNIATSRRSDRGFTMIEIAIALGVIGFALVAIIGILPMGLDVQRDNRSETIINQDATLWLEAIRSGAVGMNELPSYVSKIVFDNLDPAGAVVSSSRDYTLNNDFITGADVIGLISSVGSLPNSRARVFVTALSGAAAEKDLDPAKRELAFSYVLRVVIERQVEPPSTQTNGAALPFVAVDGEPVLLEQHFGSLPNSTSLYDIRLTFSYPYINDQRPPPRSQNYRASVARRLVKDPDPSTLFFFRP